MAESDRRWFTKRGTIRFIPNRYRALVAAVAAALLFFNLFGVLFTPSNAGNYSCGSLAFPILSAAETSDTVEDPVGWPWQAFGSVESFRCPRTMTGLRWEFAFNFVALWVCGFYLRRAVQGEVDDESPEGRISPPSKDLD
jgi:hypothetical protein